MKCNQKPYCAMERGHAGVCLDGAALTAANLTAERDEARREEALLIAEKDALRAEVERLREALRFYGAHAPDCGDAHGCTCGYSAALAGKEKP